LKEIAMNTLLFITSSLFGQGSKSRDVSLDLIARYRASHPHLTVVERHLSPQTTPHLSHDTFVAAGAAPERRTAEQTKLAAFADGLIAEVEAADVIVLAAPMYNFTIPSTVKAWIDHIARAGRTFRYTANGPEGLLKNKKLYLVASRGGFYAEGAGSAMDFQVPYLKSVFGFLGVTDVTVIPIEGQAIGPAQAAEGLESARGRVATLLPFPVREREAAVAA
jgi:FMN-dependent NADH-azoreductase